LRTVLALNDGWLFLPEQVDDSTPDSRFEPVTLPHANVVLPHRNFDNAEYQFISTYRRRFPAPELAPGQRLFVDFEGAMLASTVYLNGVRLGEYRGGFTPFSFDLTDSLVPGENLLTVHLDSRERPDIPPYGFVVDYLTFGGIYREVALRVIDAVHIADVFVHTHDVLSEQPRVVVETALLNLADAPRDLALRCELLDEDHLPIAQVEEAVSVPTGTLAARHEIALQAGDVRLWALDDPALYTLQVTLLDAGGEADRVDTRFGFREARFEADGFFLNGERLPLIGLNRHQTYPYIGAAAPARLQRRDAEIVKWELGCNLVRTSHYPQSRHFLDRCDEIGLLVFEEIPGWQHIGDAAWKANAIEQMKEMIVRDRHHPSIVLWGVRINESQDDHDFYVESNRVSRELDPTRQTGGVRCFRESEFLEDVFTFNEFSSNVREPNHVPYLITEFAGHTFPTKTFDRVERQIEHALLHTRIQDKQMGMPEIAGAIGWCAFDYNTHIDFGSGDRICYHGVSDIFRFPKFAAYLYMSQKDPAKQVVMELADFWARGDWNHCTKFLLIYSNCDEVLINGQLNGRAEPMRDEFPNLAHPPFRFDKMKDVWGHGWNDLELVGLIGGKVAIRKRWPADKLPSKLAAWTDSKVLDADGSDMTQLSFMMADRFGNVCPYATGAVTAKASCPVRIIGENPFALVGGRGALYVRSDGRKGAASIELTCTSGHKAQVKVKVG